ncbi:MAG: NUDIX hydrolase [Rhodothermaceae bacterium]|nr:MAG: NUDIX hydrolase [Rhodothermaceae bacterium]
MRPWHVLHSRYLLRRWWMNLRVDHVRLPDGTELPEFHVVEYPDWACVVCFTEEGRLVMVEQYRHGIRRACLEFPAGAVDPGEEPLQAARRELLEETGYAADDWIGLGRCAPEPSKHTNYAHLYVARAARPVRAPAGDAGEDLRVCLLEPEDVLRRVETGDLVHGIHLAALFWARSLGLFPG